MGISVHTVPNTLNKALTIRGSLTVQLGEDQTLDVKDYRGFTVAQINQSGDIKAKGARIKL